MEFISPQTRSVHEQIDGNDGPDGGRAFSFRRLGVWVHICLVMVWLLVTQPVCFFSSAGATCVLGVFLMYDIQTSDCRRFHGMLALSYYSAALAYSVVASFLALWLFPDLIPEVPTTPGMTGWEILWTQLGNVLGIFLIHILLFTILTTISALPAAWYTRTRKGSWGLVLINLPGMVLIGWVALEYARDVILN